MLSNNQLLGNNTLEKEIYGNYIAMFSCHVCAEIRKMESIHRVNDRVHIGHIQMELMY